MDNFQPDLNYLCRLCLNESDESSSFNIFSEGLSNKIILNLTLDISPNDAFPKTICRDCRFLLEKSSHFRQVAKSSDLRLKKHFRLINQNKPSNLLIKDYKDDDIEELEETYLESYRYFETAQQEIDSLRREFDTEKEKIIKNEVEKALKNLQSSKKPTTPAKSPAVSSKNPPLVLNKLAPSNQTFTSSPAVRRKRKKESTPEEVVNEIVLGNFEIQFLDKDGKVVEKSQQVYQSIELEDGAREIEFAEIEEEEEAESDEEYKPLKPRKKRAKVIETVPVKQKKSVEVSGVTIVGVQTVTNNSEDHYFIPVTTSEELDENGEKKIFQCAFEGCSEKFARRQACKTHYYNHITTKDVNNGFTCQYCRKCFKVASSLQRHERIHTGDKPFKCDFEGCEKAFSQKEMLKRHKAIHLSLNDAPFPCHLCEKKFRQKEPLRCHINKEHAEDSEIQMSSFICSICNKSFAHSSGLSRHFLIHSGKMFSCEVCGKSFNDKSALKRHGNVHNK